MVFMDNAGIILAGLFRPPSQGTKGVVGLLREDTGASVGTLVYATNNNSGLYNINPIKSVQIGKSNQAVTRQDFKIVDPFVTSPESLPFNALDGGYNSGLGKVEIPATLSPTGGSGTIKEVVKRARLNANIPIIFLRDVVGDTGFIMGESININHEVLI